MGGEGAFDEAAFVQSPGNATVNNILHFKISHLGSACLQKLLHVAHPAPIMRVGKHDLYGVQLLGDLLGALR